MLLSGELSFAQNGRPLTMSELDEAKKRNFSLQQVPVAIDGIVFFTHPDLNISRLTVKQLQDIYTGKIQNWSLLGGPNLPIVPISQDIKVHSTLKLLLGQRLENLSSNVKIVRDYTTAIRQVASTSGGISYSSASILQGQKTVHSLALASSGDTSYVSPFTSNNKVNVAALRDGTYPITRRLFVVIRRDGSLDQKAGVAYANMLSSTEGQQFIEKAGFAAIYLPVK
jgi:phosphate transport system substrate-binding protein